MLAPALAEILRSQRDAFNARFTAARRRWPHLDANDFSLFLRDQLSPFIAAVATNAPDRAQLTTQVAYDLGLQLVAEKLAGPSARDISINQLWTDLFPALAPLIAADPRRTIASLSNAAQQLSLTPGTRPDEWCAQLTALGRLCTDAAQLLTLAQLLAWRSGLAHYRTSALNAAATLPDSLALAAIGNPAKKTWPAARTAHLANPWYNYALNSPSSSTSQPTLRRVGSFRGFGGLFLTPPQVSTSGDHFLIRSGEDAWLLIADAFGATFHRASPVELAAATAPRVVISNLAFPDFPAGHVVSSSAVIGPTAVLSSTRSHTLWVGPAPASAR